MSTDGTMKAIISADNSEFKKVIQDTENTASSASAGLNKSFNGTSEGIETATQKSGFLNSSIGKIAAGVGAVQLVTKGIDVLKSSVGSAVGRFDTLNAYPKVMKQMDFSTSDTTKSVSILKKGVDGLPTSLQELTKSAQSFAILEKSATGGAKTATALNDAFIASGASSADASRGVQQYSQMLSSGKVDLMSWRTLQETMPYALTQVAKSFGLTGKSAERDLYAKLQSGDITMDQLNKRFVELDGGAKGFAQTARTASGGIGTSFTNMKNAVTNGLANTIQTINDSLKSAGLKNGISTLFDEGKQAIVKGFAVFNQLVKVAIPPIVATFKTLFDFVNQNQGWLQPLVIGIAGSIVAFKTISTTIKGVTTAIKTVQTVTNVARAITGIAKGSQAAATALSMLSKESKIAAAAQSAYNTVTKIATGIQAAFTAVMALDPIYLIVIAIAAVVAGLVYFFTQTKTGQKLWASFVKTLGSLWNSLVNIAKSVWSSITGAFNDSVKGIQNGWNGITSFFSNLWQGIVNTAVGIWNGFTSTLSGIWQGTVSAAQSVWGAITGFFSGLWNGIISVATNLWNTFGPALTTIWQGIVTVAKGVWEMLKAVIMGPILIVIDLITGGWNQLGSDLQLIWTSIVTAAQTIWTGLQTYFSGVLNLISTYFTTVWNLISSTAVAIWNGIVSTAQNIWNGLVSFMTNLWNGMVSTAVNTWNGLLNGIVSIANSIKDGAINAWNSLVSGVKNLINSLVNGAISTWNNLKSSVISIANGIKEGAINAWNALVSGVQSIIDSVVNIFDTLKNINLLDIGKAIIDGFVNGLTGAWKKGMKFISGIGDWIREHKGPIREDRKLLIPAGNAIMGGFGSSLNNAFDSVKSNVLTYADQLSGAMNNVSFNGAIQKFSDFQSRLQDNNLTAQTAIAGGNSSYSSEMSQDVLNSPSSAVTVEVHQEWDGDNVYSYVKNKDARSNTKVKLIKKK